VEPLANPPKFVNTSKSEKVYFKLELQTEVDLLLNTNKDLEHGFLAFANSLNKENP
jgi:hypothetical protein